MAEKKWKYSLINSLDLLASFPFIFASSYIKLIRFVRILRVIKLIGGINRIIHYLSTNKIYAGKLLFSMAFMLIMIVSPILILYVEEGQGNIKTAEQALWWSYCTLSTIGYGDFYPVTTVGRVLAVFVSAGGISLFGLLSGLIIERFVNSHKYEENKDNTEK
jgi:voltage-gated potassium channel